MSTRTHAGIFATPSAIPEALRMLRETPAPDTGVLSVYLDTSVGRLQGRAYLLAFRAGAKALRDEPQATPLPEGKAFEQAVARVDDYLLHTFVPRAPGVALFAAASGDYFVVTPLPRRPSEDIAWAPLPRLSQLEEVLDDFERVAVALTDKRTLRLFTLYLGELQEHAGIVSELPGQKAAGDWPNRVRTSPPRQDTSAPNRLPAGAWTGMIEGRQARRHDEFVQRHSRAAAHALVDLLRREPFDRLFVAGPEEPAELLAKSLPRPLRARLAGIFPLPVTASAAEVRQAALLAAEAVERQEELDTVDRLIQSAGSPYNALGLAATLEAASLGAIDRLVITDTFASTGRECSQCGRLAAGGDRCPACGEPMAGEVNLGERLVDQALAQGAQVEFVSGQATERLARHGGVGAFLRY